MKNFSVIITYNNINFCMVFGGLLMFLRGLSPSIPVAYPGGAQGPCPPSLAVFTRFYFKDLYLFVYMNAYYNNMLIPMNILRFYQ
jgi:hypothetical protein